MEANKIKFFGRREKDENLSEDNVEHRIQLLSLAAK